MKRIIIATIMLVAFTSSSKASFKVGDLYYSILKDKPENSVEVTWVSKDASNYAGLTDIVVPSSVTYDDVTYKVLNIGGSAFEFCDDLQSITLPNTIDRIGGYAFRGCTGLKSIVIPNSVTYINVKAFLNCSGLESVTLSNSLTFLGDNAFHGCSNLKSVVIPSSLTEIESEMFRGCSRLTSVTIPSSITSIGSQAFDGCSNLHSVSIPNSVTSIGDNAFSGCSIMVIYCEASSKPSEWSGSWNSSNRQVTWSSSYVVDGDFIFSDTEKTLLMEYNGKGGDVIIPDGVTLILENVFRDRTDITSVTMPESFKSIKSNAFRGCRNLKSINIPNKFRWFGWGAFYGCSSLESIYIPDTDNVIDASVFAGCSKLTIYCEASSKPDAWDSNWNPDGKPVVWNASPMPAEKPVESFEKTGTCGEGMKWRYDTVTHTITISGDGYIADYKTVGDIWTGLETNTPWNEFSDSIETVIVEEGVKGLGKYAFWDCDSLTTVILPSSCTDYGQSSFADCSSLQTVVVAARNIWQANSYCFYNYDKCTLYVPKDLVDYYKKEIPFNEFSNIVGINFVKIDENIVNGTIVPERYYFKDGEQVNLTPKPTNNFIVESVIVNGDTLKESTDGFVVSGINADLFISATFDVANSGQCGDSLTWAFDKAAKKLVISGNGAMPDYTASNMPWKYFKEHYGIEVVEISQGVTAVGSNAFNGCVGLDSVFISNTVASIGSNAFSGCSSLTSVTIPNTVASIGDGAFSGVNVVGYGGSATGSPWGASKMVNGVVDGDFVYSNAQKDTLIAYIGTGGNVAIPNTVTNIGISAFYGCTALTSVIIPNSVTSIGNCAFDGCSGLTSVEIPNSVTSIGNEAFDGCKGLTSVTIPNSVTSIGKSAFYECSSLTSVSIPEGVTSIEYCAFYNCKELTSVSIPGSVTTIDENAFEWCSKITSLTIPNGDLKSIGNFAFHACKGLTSLTIPDSVQNIGKCAFYECSGLTSITIPANLTSIGISAFYGCKGLTSVVVNMDEPLSIESSVFENVTLSNVKLFVPVGTKEKYEAADVWKDFDIVEGSLIQVALTSNDEAYGSVAGSGLYVENETIALSATPAVGCQFVKWSDGNTDNPRTITLTENVTLEAIFEKADAISSNAVSNMKIYAHHNVIVVENAIADIYVYDAVGRLIARRDAARNVSITMQREGIYIVKIGNEARRININKN